MRTKNSIKNISISVLAQILEIILKFVSRTVFIRILDEQYLGISGLFSNVLTVLSLAELGIGTAIVYSLYKPIADGNQSKILAIMNLYKKAYMVIGVVVLILGASITPFLNILFKDKPNIPNLEFIYLLYVVNAFVSYLFAYKRSIILADQKNYIIVLIHSVIIILLNIFQIVGLMVTKNFILYLILLIIFNFAENVVISIIANRIYPYLQNDTVTTLDKETKGEILKNVKALTLHKLSGVVTNGTDNIIISLFQGINWVGLYSNYFLVISAIESLLSKAFTSITASIGNLNAKETNQKKYDMYLLIYFANFWLYGFSSICLLYLLNPFITLWIGSKYVLSTFVVFILVFNFYLQGMRMTTLIFQEAMGLFWYDRYKPIVQALINIVASVILANYIGIAGVFLGTAISKLLTTFWIEPLVVHKYGFKKHQRLYYQRYFFYLVLLIITSVIIGVTMHLLKKISIDGFPVKFIICLIFPNVIFYIAMGKTKEFMYYKNILMSYIKKS